MHKSIFLWLVPLLAACNKAAPPPEPVRPVKTLVMGLQPAAAKLTLPGEVRAVHESPLAFRVGGKVVECRAHLGDSVQRGQLLARLEAADYQLGAQSGAAAESEARSNLEFAESDLSRYRKLHEQGFISAAQLEQKQLVADAAKERLKAFRSGHEIQSRQLAYTTLNAEQDGVLTAADCNPGQVVAVGQAVFRQAQGKAREIQIYLPEDAMPRIDRATKFQVQLGALPGKSYQGNLRELAAAADPATRTYSARISLPEADDALHLGMSASVSMPDTAGSVFRLPLAAVLSRDSHPQVWKVDKSQTVHAAAVTVSAFDGNEVRVASGLAAGDVVVIAGASLLREGQTVRLLP
ncbi:efflux RND transporter periplasmic adaptor subunit [Ferriphaselus sp. R-1]|uniref:efflux RND transporter periplasmic adaptor subunit n=1 Tax=Ferriphaselus sp. R-1 TaxID=1485544 RepID=UPI000552F947|nr:efflux RND transporter periplasmic adaptor subunit [Ferriphaselus sp. R-1]